MNEPPDTARAPEFPVPGALGQNAGPATAGPVEPGGGPTAVTVPARRLADDLSLLWPPLAFLAVHALALPLLGHVSWLQPRLVGFAVGLAADLAVLALVWRNRERMPFRGRSFPAATIVVSFVVALTLVTDKLLESREELPEVANALLGLQGPHELALAGLLLFVAAPLAEEGYFRGLLYPWLTRVVGRSPANVLASALFAALHPGTFSFLVLFAVSAIWTLVADVTGNLLAAVLGHAALNAVSLTVLLAKGWFGLVPSWMGLALVSGLCLAGYALGGLWAASRGRRLHPSTAHAMISLYSVGLAVLLSMTLATLIAGLPGPSL